MLQKTPDAAKPPAPKRRLTRRNFLIGTGAAVGLVVGYAAWPRRYPLNWAVGEGETLLNGWVKVGTDGRVTVAVPVSEIGQGIYTGLPQVLADELGADWRMVGVEPAPLHPLYAATGLVTTNVGSLPPLVRDVAAWVGSTVVERLELQMTGGSTGMKNYHDTMRHAGATARAVLCAAAAREWGVDADGCDTANGYVVYKANRMPFAEAAKLVRAADAPDEPALRPAATRRLAGKPVPRLDVPAKVDGSARFAIDVRLPGQLFAAIRHAPPGGTLVADSVRAPGGVTVVKGPDWFATLGVTTFEAERAASATQARWANPARPAGPWIEAELRKAAVDGIGDAVAEEGDVEAALKAPGGKLVDATYTVPFLAHACMEPMTATARWQDGRLELWSGTQSATLSRWAIARALDLDNDAITIHRTLAGGGFGRRAETDVDVQAATIARAIPGRPVQLVWSRAEDLGSDKFRPAAAARFRARLAPDGSVTAWDSSFAVPSVAPSFASRNMPRMAGDPAKPSAQAIEGADEIPYAVGAFRAKHHSAVTPVPLGYWRSVGHSFTGFMVESFVDELAVAAGQDPLRFRLKLLKDKPLHARVLEAAAERAGYGAELAPGFAHGIALHESFGTIAAVILEAGLENGLVTVRRATVAVDCGEAINPDLVRQQAEGSVIFGLSAALAEAIRFENGRATATNLDGFPLVSMVDSPPVDTVVVTQGRPLGGMGEPVVPPVAAALANALARSTAKRARDLPLQNAYT